MLVPVGYGEIEVIPGSPTVVQYRLSCLELLVFATVGVAFLSLFAGSLVVFLFGWLWLFGMNYLLGAVRLPYFIRRAAGV